MSRIAQLKVPEYLVTRQEAKRSERFIQILAVAGAVACIGAASFLLAPIDSMRREHQLTLDPESTRGLPPDIALMTKSGTLRALAIDFAFIRLESLKQQNKYHELNQLSSLVCKLAPHFPSVWKFAAWNLAYNVSVAQYSPQGRWYWVRQGIELLRNQGLRYNPKSNGLYLELAWIYWHKVGDFLDDQHWHYKKELAVEMERVLGAPVVAVEHQQIVEKFAQIPQAPRELDDLLGVDIEVAALVGELAKLDIAADDQLLEFVARHVRNKLQVSDILQDLEEDDIRTQHQARIELLTAEENVGPRDRLLACLRNRALRDKFNMDPSWMLKLMEDYGPIDWRSPYIHALYWATKGDAMTKGQRNLNENDSMNVARYILFGLALSIKRGNIVLDPDFDDPTNSYYDMLPDSRLIPHLHETYLRLGREQFGNDPRFIEGTAGPNFKVGHFTFLADWVRQLYTEGGPKNLALARKYYKYLRQYNLSDDGSPKRQYFQSLEKFVMQDFFDDLVGFKTANMTIGAWITRSLKYLSLGEVDLSVAAMNRAKLGWEYYMKDKYIDVGNSGRRHLAPLKDMRADAVVQLLQTPAVRPIHKARLWKALELPTRQMAYDRAAPHLLELCKSNEPPLAFARAFPVPPNMEEFRRRQAAEKPDKVIQQGEKSW